MKGDSIVSKQAADLLRPLLLALGLLLLPEGQLILPAWEGIIPVLLQLIVETLPPSMQFVLLVVQRIDFVPLTGRSINILRPIMVDRSRLVPMPMRRLPRHRSAVLMFNHIPLTPETSSRFAASLVGRMLLFLLLDGLEFVRILAIFIGGLVTYEWRLDWLIAAGFTFVLLPRPPAPLPPAVVLQLA